MALPSLNAAPQLLWLLLVWPLLWWLAQPPRPGRVLISAHRTQWLLAQRALGRRPQRFRAWRWLLASAAAGLCTLAVAAPRWPPTDGPRRLVVLLDGSASMARAGSPGSAMAQAIARARSELAALPEDIAVEVVALAHGGFARWSGAAARALAMPIAPGGTLPAPLGELATTALRQADTAVWVLTDGQDVGQLPAGATLTRVGSAAPNAAIAQVEVVDHWPLAEVHLQVRLRSCAEVPLGGVLAVAGAVTEAAEWPVALAPRAEQIVPVVVHRTRPGGELRLQLRVAGDALALDDEWLAQLAPLPELRIALAADGDARIAMGAATALAEAVGGEVVAAAAGEQAGFLLAEGGRADLPAGGAPLIAFGVAGGSEAVPWPVPLLVDWARDDPLLAGLDFSELRVDQALAATLPPGKTLLLGGMQDGTTAPLMVLAGAPAGAAVHCAFRLADSNLGLLPALPQLLLRTWRAGYAAPEATTVTPGPTVPRAESDLGRGADLEAGQSELPTFGRPAEDLGPWCLLAALLLLALRTGSR